jgi:hypothetical protein
MAEKLQLVIQIDDKGSVTIDTIKGKVDALDKSVDSSSKGPLKNFQEGWAAIAARLTIATGVIYGVGRAFSSFIDETAEAEQIQRHLRFALETSGYSWQYAKAAVDEFASSIQASTRFSDEQARQSLTDMMMYTQDFAKAQMGAKLAMDMTIRTGRDLGVTSGQIGMAMSGNVEMLGRYIPELRNLKERLGENVTAAQIWDYTLKLLQEKFGGTAQADIDSYAGKLAQFKNAWSDFKEMIGNELLPSLKELLDTLKEITKEITKEPAPYKEIPLAKFWGVEIARRVPYKGEELQEILLQRQRQAAYGSQQLAAETKKDVFIEAKKIEEDVLSYSKLMYEEWLQYWQEINVDWRAEVEKSLDAFQRAEEEKGEVAVARQELIEAGWTAQAKAEEDAIQEGLETARLLHQGWLEEYIANTKDVVDVGDQFARNFASAWDFNIQKIISESENMGDAIKNVFSGMADAFASAISRMISNWALFGSITGEYKKGSGVVGWVGSLLSFFKEGGLVQGWKPLAAYQEGGLITKPTLGMIGEGGPEAVIPLKGGKIPVENMAGKNNMTVFYIKAMDPISFRDFVRRNPEAIIEAIHQNSREAGVMRGH